MTWMFKTSLGVLRILKMPNSRYALYLDNELLGSYHTPEGAAEAVSTCSTGHHGWDGSSPVLTPRDLSEWQDNVDCPTTAL